MKPFLTFLILCLSLPAFGVVTDWAPFWRETRDDAGRQVHVQAMGPVLEEKHDYEAGTSMATFRPLWINYRQESTGSDYFYLLPPLFTYYHDNNMLRWEFYTFVQRRITGRGREDAISTFMIFPFVFYHDVPGRPRDSFFGVMPLGGSVKDYFGFDRISWALFPLAAEFEDRGVIRYGFPWPFITWQEGDGAAGGGLWPIFTHYTKSGVRAYDSQYLFWPLIYRKVDQFDRERPRVQEGFLPFYATVRSELVDDTTIFFPFFGWRDDREISYRETRWFWPFFVQGRGPGNYVNRWAPFYTHSIHGTTDKHWYMWPALRVKRWQEGELAVRRTNFFYFLYMDEVQRSMVNPNLPEARMTHVWPFFSQYDNGAGLVQAQLFSPFEVFYPNNRSVRDLYTPIFAFFRYQRSEETGVTTQSVLWNFIREECSEERTRLTVGPLLEHDVSEGRAKFSLLKGLFGHKREDGESTFTLFWMDI